MPPNRSKPPKKIFGTRTRRGRRIPISILILAAVVALIGLVQPNRQLIDVNPANVRLPTATPWPTPLPAPTDVHGGHIVFTCTRNDVNQICMIAADGTGYVQLTEGSANSYYPAISSNGNDIVFAVNQYDVFDLFRLALDVTQDSRQTRSRVKRLTDNLGNTFSPSFSPDGKQVAFLNGKGAAPAAIWLMQGDGQDPHQIFAGTGNIVALAWSPNGHDLAFCMSTGTAFSYEIFLLDLRNLEAAPVQVSRGLEDIGGSIAWSPDGQDLLLFAGPAAAREIYRMHITDSSVTQLTYGGNNASPSYSPDGRYIVFNSLRNGGQADLYVMRADGHSTRQLTAFAEPDWQPKWGP